MFVSEPQEVTNIWLLISVTIQTNSYWSDVFVQTASPSLSLYFLFPRYHHTPTTHAESPMHAVHSNEWRKRKWREGRRLKMTVVLWVFSRSATFKMKLNSLIFRRVDVSFGSSLASLGDATFIDFWVMKSLKFN